jgi:hypothetical protein
MEPNNQYMLLDSRSIPLARCVLTSAPDSPTWQIRVLEDKVKTVMQHETVQLVSMSSQGCDLLGRIVRCRGDQVVIQRMRQLGSEIREHFRIPVDYASFAYPITGEWKGRREVRLTDLSCGGLGFSCKSPFEIGEEFEVVIPTTEQPLISQCKVLRSVPSVRKGIYCYGAKFIHMCDDEETLVRRTVFTIQLQGRSRVRPVDAPK